MTGYGLGQRIDHKARPRRARTKQVRRGERIVDDEDDAPVAAQRANPGKVGDLGAWIGDGLDKDQPRIGPQRCGHMDRVGGVDKADLYAKALKRAQDAGRIAKHIAAADHMVARPQQGQKRRRDRRHAGGETNAGARVLQKVDLGLQSRARRVALSSIGKAGRLALKHPFQGFGRLIAVEHAGMHRRMDRPVPHARLAVGVQKGRGDSGGVAVFGHASILVREAC